MKSDYATPFIEKRELNWCIDWIRRDWRGSNPQLPPWQGGALTNWTTIPGKWKDISENWILFYSPVSGISEG